MGNFGSLVDAGPPQGGRRCWTWSSGARLNEFELFEILKC